jgi:O-antigen/teichoic acid export membrane protein
MLAKIKLSTGQILIYSIGNIATKLTGFVLFPVYASHIPISDYRSLILLEPIWQLLTALLAVSLPTALLRWLPSEPDKRNQKSLVFTTLMALLAILAVFNLLAYPANHFLGEAGAYSSPEFKKYLDLTFPLISFDILNLLVLSLLRFQERPWLYIALNGVKLSVNIILNIYLITGQGMGVESIIISQLAASMLLNILAFGFLLKNLTPRFNFSALKQMMAFGFPLIFTAVSAIILSFSDRYIIDHFLTKAETGVYGVGYKFGGIINMFVIQSFQLGFLPIAFKMLDEPGAKRFFARILTYFLFVLVFLGLAISLFAREILILFSAGEKDYAGAFVVVPLITLGFVIKGLQYYFSLGLYYVKKTAYNAWIVMGCALISIAMNLALVPVAGIYGAAITLMATTTLMAILYYYFAQKHYPIPFETKRLLLIAAAGLLLFFAGSLPAFESIIINLLIKLICIIFFPVLLFFSGFFDPDEKNRLLQLKAHMISIFRNKRPNDS